MLQHISNSVKALRPLVLFISVIICSSMILSLALFGETNHNVMPTFSYSTLLEANNVFETIARCADQSDGLQCFDRHEQLLLDELKNSGVSPEGLEGLAKCFSLLTFGANDLTLLLNIQSCYFEQDSIELFRKLATPKISINFAVKICTCIFVFAIITLVSIMSIPSKDKEIANLKQQLEDMKTVQNFLLKHCTVLKTEISALRQDIRSSLSQDTTKSNGEVGTVIESSGNAGTIKEQNIVPQKQHLNTKPFVPQVDTNKELTKEKEVVIKEKTDLVAQVGGRRFNLTDEDDRVKWKEFCQGSVISTTTNPTFSSIGCISSLSSIDSSNLIITHSDENNHETEDKNKAKFQSIQLADKNGKPYRRVFVPGKGWTSVKKLKDEKLPLM